MPEAKNRNSATLYIAIQPPGQWSMVPPEDPGTGGAPSVRGPEPRRAVDPVLRSLERAVAGAVTADPESLARVGRDGSHLIGHPFAVVAPRDPADVVSLVAWARAHRVPLVARGGGSSLDGESVPIRGGVVVEFAAWSRVLEVRAEEGSARVEPGVVNLDLQAALRPHGTFFPPNPGSWGTSTIGGNVGTNASGPRSFRYGATRAWVREVELVLGTGARARWGSRARKRSVGPDLLAMFVGSEGTLGIATEVSVRTAPLPPVRRGLVVPLPDRVALGRIAIALAGAPGSGLSAIEYLDRACADELAGSSELGLAGGHALLLLEVEAEDERDAERRSRRVGDLLRAAGVDGPPEPYDDANALWSVRGQASVALDRRVGERIREDVAVPLAAIDDLARAIERIAAAERVPVYLFAHLGDGNLHPNFVVPPAGRTAARVRARLLDAALRRGGTISAEHGIGAIKSSHLERELGRPGVEVLRALKRVCDPAGILNPGKLYPSRAAPRPSRSPSGSGARAARPGGPSDGRDRPRRGGPRRSSPRRRAAPR
jgi:FAD/FMN-containing dehydrogenase